ncbi:unnamed protein product [Heterosigma akashiwo]
MDSKLTRQQFFKKSVATTTGAVFAATQLKEPALAAAVKAPSLEGGAAPTFKLPSNTGKDISLEDLTSTGKYTILYFYPGDFTQGCTIEANAFERDFDEFAKLNAQIVGVAWTVWTSTWISRRSAACASPCSRTRVQWSLSPMAHR